MYISNEPTPQNGVAGDLTTMADVIAALLEDPNLRMRRSMMSSLGADLRDLAAKVEQMQNELQRSQEAAAYWTAAAMSQEQQPQLPAPEPITNIVPFVWRKVA